MVLAYSRTALHTRIHALIYNQGLPSIFLTLNPADIHSPVVLYFAGVKVDLDNIQMKQLMDNYKRAEIIASHPVATAKYFHLLISNILDTIIVGGVLRLFTYADIHSPAALYFAGVKLDLNNIQIEQLMDNYKRAEIIASHLVATAKYFHLLISNILDTMIVGGILGPIEAYFGTVESQGRVPRSWNTPPRLSRDNIYAVLSTIDLTGLQQNIYGPNNIISTPLKEQFVSSILHVFALSNKLLQTPTRNQSTSVINTSYNESKVIQACLPTPNPSSPNFASRFRADVVQLVKASNIHKHSDTCYKYWNANKGDKKSCRMRMPRTLVPVSTIDPDTGHISMRRSDPSLNNFNEYLIAACRSNMDMKFIWNGSDAKALIYYITDYVTKMSLSFHDTFALVQKSITLFQNSYHQPGNESAIEKSRKLVLCCYNTLASQQELSGVQVGSYLMNLDDHYTTHKFQGLYLIKTERFLQTELNEIRAQQTLKLATYSEYTDI
ncbi:unnamed protein product [Rotaria sordida]|uniref:Helitron helicase-like domain-containing protein n=1 Tax=Rotaria sordida TaxID=392033 RepID=A0A815A820_9BILA|nr:unnamed protein product [Rotaria sordida]